MDLPQTLRQQIQTLDRTAAAQNNAERTAQEQAKTQSGEAARTYKNMNFREKYLLGWFGGNRAKVAHYRKAKTLSAQFNDQAATLAGTQKELNRQINTALDSYLRENDPTYQTLLEPREKAEQARAAIKHFRFELEGAADSIDDAQTLEMLDLASSNTSTSILSTVCNEDAKAEINDLKKTTPVFEKTTPVFEKAMQEYDGFLKTYKLPPLSAKFGDRTDLAFDLLLPAAFDFTSLLSLSALDKTEKDLNTIRTNVTKLEKFVCTNHDKAEKTLAEYRTQVRQLCL